METSNDIINMLLRNNNKDLIITALDNMDDKTVLQTCQVNKQLNDICKDVRAEWMWKNRVLKRFNEKALSYKESDTSWRQYFLDLLYLDEMYIPSKAIEKAAERQSLPLIKVFTDKGGINWDMGIYQAAKKNNKELIDFFLEQAKNDQEVEITWAYVWGSYGAAEGGHLDLLKYFFDKGGASLNATLRYAVKGGNIDVIQFLINRGANDWNNGMIAASSVGDKELVQFFIDKGANDWYNGLRHSGESGNKEVIQFFNEKYLKYCPDKFGTCHHNILCQDVCTWDWVMQRAARKGNREYLQFFIDKGARNWYLGMRGAIEGENIEALKFFLDKIKDVSLVQRDYQRAKDTGNKEVLRLMNEKIETLKK